MRGSVDLDQALSVAVTAARNAGGIIRRARQKEISATLKEGRDLVTEVDIAAEREIVETIRKHFPDHRFLSEELGSATPADDVSERYEWVVDPIDGTINLVSGLPLFSTSIALQENGRTLLGVIHNPISGEMFTSIVGRGSFVNGERLRVSSNDDVGACVFSFMLTSHYNEEEVESILRLVRKLAIVSRGVRLYVSQAMELAYIAAGKLAGTVCVKSRGFSAAAGALLVREAGGVVTDLLGRQFDNSSRSLLASSSSVHKHLLRLLE